MRSFRSLSTPNWIPGPPLPLFLPLSEVEFYRWTRSGVSSHCPVRSGRERSASLVGSCNIRPKQATTRSQHEPYGHHIWAIVVLELTQLPFQASIGSINTNAGRYCQGGVVCGSEGCHGFDFGYFCRIRRGVLPYMPNNLKHRSRVERSVIYILCLYRPDAAGDQLIGQLRHFRHQWSVGRGALEPLQRLVFWCGPR